VQAPPDRCPSCGGPIEPGQEYCLRCGRRIVPARRLSSIGYAWQRRLGRYPGDWIWASIVLLLVAAGSATAGIVTARDTGATRGSETIVATSRIVTAPATAGVPLPSTSSTTTTAAPRVKPSQPARRTSLAEWPARDGYTVVLASIPARGNGLKDATATAKAALARGLHDVGVLASARFASLHPGYYVVFAGVYPSLQDAQTAAGRAASRYPNAYAREITR
jgi:hypothetical protein